jgi:hypothetical protein
MASLLRLSIEKGKSLPPIESERKREKRSERRHRCEDLGGEDIF